MSSKAVSLDDYIRTLDEAEAELTRIAELWITAKTRRATTSLDAEFDEAQRRANTAKRSYERAVRRRQLA